jgi:hypothetical protein
MACGGKRLMSMPISEMTTCPLRSLRPGIETTRRSSMNR